MIPVKLQSAPIGNIGVTFSWSCPPAQWLLNHGLDADGWELKITKDYRECIVKFYPCDEQLALQFALVYG